MKRFWGHIWTASFVAAIGGLLLPACAHDDSSLYVAQIVLPPRPDITAGCLYAVPATTIPGQFEGRLDVGLANAYSPVALVANQLNTRGDQVNVRTETNRVQVRGAIVRVTDAQGNQLSTFTSLADGVVDPQSGTTPGLGLIQVTIVDPATIKALQAELPNRGGRKTLVSYFKVFGQTLGGTYIESAEFQYVVVACNGCLVDFPPDAVDPNPQLPQPNCLAPFNAAAATSNTLQLACVEGQDQVVDCRLCQGTPACDPSKLR